MSAGEAFRAWEHADEIIRGAESIDELDNASNYDTAMEDCPRSFTPSQKQLAQMILCRAYERAIGRA